MAIISVSDKDKNKNNFEYVKLSLSEVIVKTSARVDVFNNGARQTILLNVNDEYKTTVQLELADKLAEIVAVNYKYNFFKANVCISGLSKLQTEILLTALISADFEEDKAYAFSKLKTRSEFALDGAFNFQMKPLKKKWVEIVGLIPQCFTQNQLCDFLGLLIENRRKKVYVDGGKVYDNHYRRLNRVMLLDGEEEGAIVREVLLSCGGDVEIEGDINKSEEKLLSEYFCKRINVDKDFQAF